MKNIFTAVILGIALAGISLAQTSSKASHRTGGSDAPRMAVVEFTTGPNASVMDRYAKRDLQAFIASRIHQSRKFKVVDVRNTREASKSNLAALNGAGTAAAVKLGKQLDVSYVLTGTVVEYDNKSGQVTLKARLVEVATGKVRYSGESTGQSSTPIRSGGNAEMMSKAVRPAILDLTARLTGA
ncbi:MAG: hypothetical protein AB7F88_03570 [Pyrinomonadaceae bacterium]